MLRGNSLCSSGCNPKLRWNRQVGGPSLYPAQPGRRLEPPRGKGNSFPGKVPAAPLSYSDLRQLYTVAGTGPSTQCVLNWGHMGQGQGGGLDVA